MTIVTGNNSTSRHTTARQNHQYSSCTPLIFKEASSTHLIELYFSKRNQNDRDLRQLQFCHVSLGVNMFLIDYKRHEDVNDEGEETEGTLICKGNLGKKWSKTEIGRLCVHIRQRFLRFSPCTRQRSQQRPRHPHRYFAHVILHRSLLCEEQL